MLWNYNIKNHIRIILFVGKFTVLHTVVSIINNTVHYIVSSTIPRKKSLQFFLWKPYQDYIYWYRIQCMLYGRNYCIRYGFCFDFNDYIWYGRCLVFRSIFQMVNVLKSLLLIWWILSKRYGKVMVNFTKIFIVILISSLHVMQLNMK